MASTMTPDQAHAFRTAHDTEVKTLSRKPKYELMAILRSETGAQGTYSKDEAINAILTARGFGIEKLNEAIHAVGHQDTPWPDCPYCQQDDPPEHEPGDGEAQRIAEVYADARAEQDRGL